MNTCYIVGGGDFDGFFDKKNKGDLIIAADKGYEHLKKVGLVPDIIVGDFDSSKEPDFKEKIKLKPEKDMTDTYAAVEIGIEKGYKNFVIYGGLGGRVSHTMANISLAHEFKNKGIDIKLKSKKILIFIIKDKLSCKFDKSKENYFVSIFSLSEIAKKVTIKGLKYELEDYDLANSMQLGVSNETISKDYEISLKEGQLLIIYENKNL